MNLPFWNIGVFIKIPIEFLCLIVLSQFKKFHFVYLLLLFLLVFWLIGFGTTYFNYGGVRDSSYGIEFEEGGNSGNPILASFTVLNRYFLFFALMPMILLHLENENFIKLCQKLFEVFLYANSFAIIIGFLFGIQLFSSYNAPGFNLDYEGRFGYKGLLYGINETTGVYFLGIAYAYRELFVFKTRKYLLLGVLLLSSFLTGAKGCIISAGLLSFYYLFSYKRRLLYSIVIPGLAVAAVYLVKIDFIEKLSAMFNLFMALDDASPFNALLTFFMTGRNLYIHYNWLYMASHWNILNYLFGDGVLYSETDFFDLYYFFGLGAFIYFYGYLRLIFYKKKERDLKSIVLLLLLIAFTGGHIIRSGVLPVFLCLYLITGYLIKCPKEEIPPNLSLVTA